MPPRGALLLLAATLARADRDSLSPGSDTSGPGEPETSEERATSLADGVAESKPPKKVRMHPTEKPWARTSKRRPLVDVPVDPTKGTTFGYRVYHNLKTALSKGEEPLPEKWTKELSKLKEIPSGVYGQMYDGTVLYRGTVLCNKSRSMVVKRETVRQDNPKEDMQDEIKMMMKFKGKRFINIYGEQVGSTHVDILMENGQGGSLFSYLYTDTKGIKEREGLSRKVKWQLFVEILHGIKTMHDEGYMHLDLKPENIFVDADCLQRRCHAKVGDLRDACSHSPPAGLESTTCKNVTKGTVEYFAPELWNHLEKDKVTNATVYTKAIDIWALGMLLYELSFRKLPHDILKSARWEPDLKKFVVTKFDITQDPFYKTEEEEEDLQSLLAGMLAKEPGNRWDVDKVLTQAQKLAEKSEAKLDDDGEDFSQPPACWGKAQ